MARVDSIAEESAAIPQRSATASRCSSACSARRTGRRSIPPLGRPRSPVRRARSRNKIDAFYAEGVDHIQIVLTPITLEAIETLAPVVEQLKS